MHQSYRGSANKYANALTQIPFSSQQNKTMKHFLSYFRRWSFHFLGRITLCKKYIMQLYISLIFCLLAENCSKFHNPLRM